VKLLTVAIIGFLNNSLIACLLKLCFSHQYANWYFSKQENGDHGSISSSKRSKYLLLIWLLARQLSKCGVPTMCVRTEDYSRLINACSLSTSMSLESPSEGGSKGSRCGSCQSRCRILLFFITKPSSVSILADTYTILSMWSRRGSEMKAPM